MNARRRKPIDVILECKTPDPKVRRRRDAPAPVPAEHARCISALHTDGSTKFAAFTDRAKWHPSFAMLFDKLLDLQAKQYGDPEDIPDEEEIPDVIMPLPRLPADGRKLGLAGVLEADGRIDYRTRGFAGFEGLPIARVNVSGRAITLYFEDRCYVTFSRRRDPQTQRQRWYVKLDAKARELYERGDREWMRTWLGFWSWLLFGTWAEPGTGNYRELGWGTTIWHINSDFVGLEFVNEDALDVTATRKRTLWGKTDRPEWDVDDEDDDDDTLDAPEDDDEVDDDECAKACAKAEWMQTMDLGRIGSDIRVIGYKKGDHLRELKKIEPGASKYMPRWGANGYEPAFDGDPYRVEIRARKKGLVYRHKDRDEVIYDFRDPDMLLNDEARRAFWAYVTARRRVAVREPGPRGGARPLRKCATDPRWMIVQAAANRPVRADIRQMPHLVAALTRAEREAKSTVKLFDAVQTLSLIRYGTAIAEPVDFAAELELLAQRIRSGELNVETMGAKILPHPVKPIESIRRKPSLVQFFQHELVGLHEAHADALRQRGGTGGMSVFDLLPLPPEPEEDDPPDHTDDTEPDG